MAIMICCECGCWGHIEDSDEYDEDDMHQCPACTTDMPRERLTKYNFEELTENLPEDEKEKIQEDLEDEEMRENLSPSEIWGYIRGF